MISLKETGAPDSSRIRYHFPIPSISSPRLFPGTLAAQSCCASTMTPLRVPGAESTSPTQGQSPAWEVQAQFSGLTGHFFLDPISSVKLADCDTQTLTHLRRGKLCDPKGHSRPRTNPQGLTKGLILQSITVLVLVPPGQTFLCGQSQQK